MKRKQPQHRKRLILDLMRLRLASGVAQGVDVRDSGSYGGVTIKHKGKTVGIAVPTFDDAYGRTVRVHESIHAKMRTKKALTDNKFSDITKNVIEDLVIHVRKWKQGFALSVHRDAACVACKDLRSIGGKVRKRDSDKPLYKPLTSPASFTVDDADDYNMALLIGCRAMGMLWRLDRCNIRLGRTPHFRRLVRRSFRMAIPTDLVDAFSNIITLVNRNQLATAAALFEALLIKYCPEDWQNEVEQGGKKEPTDNELTDSGMREVPMRIVDLQPKTVPLELRKNRKCRRRNKGSRLNTARLVNAVVSGSVDRLFKKTITIPMQGGTVLIDASGSMEFTEASIKALMLAAPASTIAYYCGWGHIDADGYIGALYIVARDGRLFDGRLPHPGGGNDVDRWALDWAAEQDKPLVIVTDGHFCGGPPGQGVAAHATLRLLVADGAVWLRDVDDAIIYFRGLTARRGLTKHHFATTYHHNRIDKPNRERCKRCRCYRHRKAALSALDALQAIKAALVKNRTEKRGKQWAPSSR